ncbi:MAG TPA: DsrE family protein [Bacteroidales bacterium]|nr:DsrE family protein [Bacteroidales bacterium]
MEKIVIISTKGPHDPETATIAFVMAAAAQTNDYAVTVILQSDAVWLAKKGEVEKIHAPALMPLAELMNNFLGQNGQLMLCSPCLKERNIGKDDLIDNSTIIAAGTVIDEITSAKAVLTY